MAKKDKKKVKATQVIEPDPMYQLLMVSFLDSAKDIELTWAANGYRDPQQDFIDNIVGLFQERLDLLGFEFD